MKHWKPAFRFLIAFCLTLLCFCGEPAIPDNHLQEHNNASLPVDRLPELKIGESTLSDVNSIFGFKERKRRTYKKNLLPKVYKGKQFAIYRIVNYTAYSVNQKHLCAISETTWRESLDVTFFFNKENILLLHTTRHRLNDGGGRDHAAKYHNIEGDPDELWPGSVCDGIFHKIYETKAADPYLYANDEYFKKCVWYNRLRSDIKRGLFK